MLDIVKEVRFPTVEELKTLHDRYSIPHSWSIMCTVEERPHNAVKFVGEEMECSYISDSIVCASVVFHPVFEIAPEYAALVTEDYIPRIARFLTESNSIQSRYFAAEPTALEGVGVVRLSKTAFISLDIASSFISWHTASQACCTITHFDYVLCPYCGAIHRMPNKDNPDIVSTVTRCNRCGREFISSRASHVGVKMNEYQHLANCPSTFVISDGIEVPMQNEKDADCIVLGWPAGTRAINQYNIFETYKGGQQTTKAMMAELFGSGWDKIDVIKLRDRMAMRWNVEFFDSLDAFLGCRLTQL